GTRLPTPAASAEEALRAAAQALRVETDRQLVQWLHSLGMRGLEALARMYLSIEGFALQASLPAGKGIGKLIAIDPESDDDDPRVLVVVVPRKSAIDPGGLAADLERLGVASALVITTADGGDW